MNNKELFFDSMAYKWDEIVEHDSNKIISVLESLEIRSSDNILDIGTGTGVLIPFLLDRLGMCGSITAMDISSKMLEIAKLKYSSNQVEFIKQDFLKADMQESFDIVLCYSCFPHFNDKRKAVEKMLKLLKKGGKLAIFHSEGREKIDRLHSNMNNQVQKDRLPAAEELISMIESYGGRVVHIEDSEKIYVIVATL